MRPTEVETMDVVLQRLSEVSAKLDEIDRLLDESGRAERVMEMLARTIRETVTVNGQKLQLTAPARNSDNRA